MTNKVAFTKYDERGAYHWREIVTRSPRHYSSRLHALYDFFLRQAADRRPTLVLDIGCGDGALTHLVSQVTQARVVGVEPEVRGIELARSALGAAGSSVEVAQGRGECLPFDDGEASMVILCEVIEHVEHVEPILAEARRVLASDGVLLVSTPQWQTPALRPFHVREYTAADLWSLLAKHFALVEVHVSEPGWLHDSYAARREIRLAVNLLALAGLNPMRVRRPAASRHARWRQLFAVAR